MSNLTNSLDPNVAAGIALTSGRRDGGSASSMRQWTIVWAVLACLGWLLPNHYYPWITFHTDAWVAWAFVIAGGALLMASSASVPWHRLTLLTACLLAVPFLQWLAGLIHYPGQAWLTSAFVLGFLLCLLVGARAQEANPDQALDALFLAIGLACIGSVGIELRQWLWQREPDIWVVPLAELRPFGNLAQPNQMATLHLWGIVAAAWGLYRGYIRRGAALALVLFLLIGIALTQSRTAIVAICMLLVLAVWWRRLWPSPRQVLASAAGLAVFFGACLLAIGPISQALLLDKPYSAMERIGGHDIRSGVYKLFIDAALQEPWWGYGWSPVSPAQFAVAERHPALGGVFQQSHNLFLDFVLWMGIPLGGAVSLCLVAWYIRQVKRVSSAGDALLAMFISVVGLHAMLELPLHYAYMLLPTGLVIGAFSVRLGAPVVFRSSRRVVLAMWFAAAVLLAAITRDYFLIEANFQALRFERAYNMPAQETPRVLVLSQLADFLRMGRSSARPGMTQQELDEFRDGANAFPSPSNLYVYTAALALNGRGKEAQLMMRKMQRTMSPGAYDQMGRVWADQTKRIKTLSDIPWLPSEVEPPPRAPEEKMPSIQH
jgi:hypothetical protein